MQNNMIQKPFDFVSVENSNTQEVGIKITSGEFAGAVVTIGKISFDEDDDQSNCKMNFDYELQVGEIAEDRKKDFEDGIGNLVLYLLVESIQNGVVSDLIGESNDSD